MMDHASEIAPSMCSAISRGDSGTPGGRRRNFENKIQQYFGTSIEQKLQTLRTLMLGHSYADEHFYSTEPPPVQPLKPMPYVRRFTVSVSLKKPRGHRNTNAIQWSIGKRQFNENPEEGFRWLIENNLIQNTPEHMAAFLMNETGLSKRAIGNFLGEKDEVCIEVLKQYAHMHDFFSKDIVEALRRYLSKFILPGESQKIERIMEAFAQRYYECNPDVYANAEVCFLLSYAIIMLNTSLHNRSASMAGSFTYENFYHNLNGAIAKQNMPDSAIIRNIYDSIRKNAFEFPDDDMDLSNISTRIRDGDSTIIKEGWLWKQGARVRSWKRRWFILTDACLCYYESRTDMNNLRGMVPLVDIGVRETEDDRTRQFCFELFPLVGEKMKSSKPNEAGKMTDSHHTVYRMSASTDDERKEWIRALRIGSQNELPKQKIS